MGNGSATTPANANVEQPPPRATAQQSIRLLLLLLYQKQQSWQQSRMLCCSSSSRRCQDSRTLKLARGVRQQSRALVSPATGID